MTVILASHFSTEAFVGHKLLIKSSIVYLVRYVTMQWQCVISPLKIHIVYIQWDIHLVMHLVPSNY